MDKVSFCVESQAMLFSVFPASLESAANGRESRSSVYPVNPACPAILSGVASA
jgi:hypothetical protein